MITNAIIDTRGEPDWNLGAPTLKMPLDAGDVMCSCDDGNTVLIERKTPSDFLSTLAASRLFPQVARMIEITPWSYIVITGIFYRKRGGVVTVDGRITGWNYDAIEGAKLTCQEMGAGVIHCGSDDFEDAVIRLCNRDRSTKRITPPRETALLTEGEAAIAALPGIGYERVQALAKLGSPARMLEWLTDLEDSVKIPSVADGTKRKVIKALGLAGEKLAIVHKSVRPFYLPDGEFIATSPEGYDWICKQEGTSETR
jgi:ERCC4-type nuclease